MEFLKSAYEKITELFSISESEEGEDALVINNLNNIFDEIIFLFCKSILIGEHITDNDDCKVQISKIKDKISNEETGTIDITGEIPEVFLNIRDALKFITEFYEVTLSFSKELLLTESDESLFVNFDTFGNNAREITDNALKTKCDLFFYCLQTFNIDSQFLEENSTAEVLHSIKSSISSIHLNDDLNAIRQALIEKVDFLISKWIIRRKETENRLLFNENGVVRNLEVTRHLNQSLNNWIEYINLHYQFNNHWKSEITRNAKKIINGNESEYSLFQLHSLIKYYKDVSIDIKKLQDLYKSLCVVVNQNNFANPFDRYAYAITSNYALNNYFSLFSQNCNSLEELEKKYNYLTREKDAFDVNNFFLEYKLLFHSFRIINLQLLKESSSQDIDSIKINFDEFLTKIYNEYKFRITWSNNHTNYIFQLPINESIIDVGGIKVFFISSFVLPVPLKRINNDFEDIKIGYESLYNELHILKRVTVKIEENYSILDEIKKRELKSIEMIGIFTAVISFIIGTIGSFKYIESFFSSLVFMVVYSISLISFLIVLTIFTRGKKTLEDNRINFFYFYCATISVLLFLFIFKTELESVGSITKSEISKKASQK